MNQNEIYIKIHDEKKEELIASGSKPDRASREAIIYAVQNTNRVWQEQWPKKEKKTFYELRSEIIKMLQEIKGLPEFDNEYGRDYYLEFASSAAQYLDFKHSDKELATEIYKYQYGQQGSVERRLYELLYAASEDTIAKIGFGFPMEVEAFRRFGRTGIYTLEKISKGENNEK